MDGLSVLSNSDGSMGSFVTLSLLSLLIRLASTLGTELVDTKSTEPTFDMYLRSKVCDQ